MVMNDNHKKNQRKFESNNFVYNLLTTMVEFYK